MKQSYTVDLQRGVFLIASPEIEDDTFRRSVVLLCDHSEVGSFGLIVNKPMPRGLPENQAYESLFSHSPLSLRLGGPLQKQQMMLLHTSDAIPEKALKVSSEIHLGGDTEFLQEELYSDIQKPLLLCFGFSAWTSNLLQSEVENNIWFIHPATKEHLFHTEPSELWKTLLKEMGGKFATFADIPDDLSLN